MNKIIFTFMVLFTSLSCMAHGHLIFKTKNIHAHLNWVKGPLIGDESTLRVDFKNAADHSVNDFKSSLAVKVWMPEMGHGSATTIIAPFKDEHNQVVPGSYLVSNIYFVMGGLWQLLFTVTDEKGSETQTWDVNTAGGDEEDHHHH